MSTTETEAHPKNGLERDLAEVAALNLPKTTPDLLSSRKPELSLLDLDLGELTTLITWR